MDFIRPHDQDYCSIKSCKNKDLADQFLNFERYCNEHYAQFIWEVYHKEYESWEYNAAVPYDYKRWLGRLVEENFISTIGSSYLSTARIRDRAFNFIKTETGCTFEITRHLNAWEGTGKPKRIVELWTLNNENKTLELTSSRNFRKKDFDF